MDTAASIILPPEDPEAILGPGRRELEADLRRGFHVKMALAAARQQEMAAAFAELGPLHSDPLGQLTMVVDPALYFAAIQRFGRGCWQDKGFRRDYANANPEVRIRSRSRRGATILRP